MAALSGFAYRLAFIRWIRSIGRQKPESDREFAGALGVGEKWLGKWKDKAQAPEGRSEASAIQSALEPMGVSIGWLYDGVGAPPDSKLWTAWTTEPSWKRVAQQHGGEVAAGSEVKPEKKALPARRAAASGDVLKKG